MLSFFNSNDFDKFIVCGASEVSLYELKDKDPEADFIYESPKLQNISSFSIITRYQFFTQFVYFCR